VISRCINSSPVPIVCSQSSHGVVASFITPTTRGEAKARCKTAACDANFLHETNFRENKSTRYAVSFCKMLVFQSVTHSGRLPAGRTTHPDRGEHFRDQNHRSTNYTARTTASTLPPCLREERLYSYGALMGCFLAFSHKLSLTTGTIQLSTYNGELTE